MTHSCGPSDTSRLQQDARFSQQRLEEFTEAAQAKLSPAQFQKLSTADLTRFIVAREGSVESALKQLLGAVEFSEAVLDGSQGKECELCAQDPTSHSHVPVGVLQAPEEPSTIFYGCPARATQTAVDPIVHHVARQLEYCFRLPNTGSRWVWCVDYNGFGFKEAMQGKLGAKFAALFGNHMPERLHKILLLNPPSIFRLLIQAIKPFADKRTLDKLIPVTGSTQVVLKILKDEHCFPHAVLEWLEPVLNQKLPNILPPLPSASKHLLLPSLVPVMNISSNSNNSASRERYHPSSKNREQTTNNVIKTTRLLSGYMDAQSEIQVMA